MLERKKPYKNVEPMVTINNIRQILFQHDIFVIETSQKKDPLTGVCSCRVILGDDGLRELNIGSNGKGMDSRYALASAYAEFLERLQNGALLWKIIGIPKTLPNAKNIDANKYKEAVYKVLRLAYGDGNYDKVVNRLMEDNDYKTIEFTEYTSGEKLLFPVDLLNRMTGSNGMAAGNTLLEAIIQGLSEIFERKAIQDIFLEKATVPIIDSKFFEGNEVIDRLNMLKKKEINYRILDCSLEQGLPVIGLLLEKDGKYHVHFGADPSPITALERCLTETFQGRNINELPLYEPLKESEDEQVLFENEKKEYTDSSGQVPSWLVNGCNAKFKGFVHEKTVSDEDDMNYYLQILSDMKCKLFVCKMNNLGFPAVRLYVPGITENHCPNPDYCIEKKVPVRAIELLRKLPLLTDDDFHELARIIKKWLKVEYGYEKEDDICRDDYLNLKYNMPVGNFNNKIFEGPLLIAAIFCRGGYDELGMRVFEKYVSKKSIPEESAEFLRVKLKSKKTLFLPTEWPSCPDCDKCRSRNICSESILRPLASRLEKVLS